MVDGPDPHVDVSMDVPACLVNRAAIEAEEKRRVKLLKVGPSVCSFCSVVVNPDVHVVLLSGNRG